jgi:tripartite-type tricarboxylate transporter receptor subunit TctC
VHVSFKGSPEALREVIAERIDFYFCPLSTALPLVREGRVRALAVNTATGANAYVAFEEARMVQQVRCSDPTLTNFRQSKRT